MCYKNKHSLSLLNIFSNEEVTMGEDGNKHPYSGEIFKKQTEHKNPAKLVRLGKLFFFFHISNNRSRAFPSTNFCRLREGRWTFLQLI